MSDNRTIQLWPDMVPILNEDLAWLVKNQAEIVRLLPGTRSMPKPRPVLYYTGTGKVRVEFVGTYSSAEQAVRFIQDDIGPLVKGGDA